MQLLTIDDLHAPNNDWKPLLEHVAVLQTIYEQYKARYRSARKFEVYMSGDGDRAPGLHASELCGCLRQATYSLHGTPKDADVENTDTNMLRRFDIGACVHALLQDDFQRMCMGTNGRIVFDHEIRIDASTNPLAAKYEISSSCDGAFTFYNEQDRPYLRVGLEIKTMSGDEYIKAKKPKEVHITQGTLYQKFIDLPLIWYLYYNKSNSNYTPPLFPWIVPFDKNTWNRLESKAQQAHSFRAQGGLPEREEGMPCSWCAYAKTCGPKYLTMNRGPVMPVPATRARRLT